VQLDPQHFTRGTLGRELTSHQMSLIEAMPDLSIKV
jgi:hypothetical protein